MQLGVVCNSPEHAGVILEDIPALFAEKFD